MQTHRLSVNGTRTARAISTARCIALTFISDVRVLLISVGVVTALEGTMDLASTFVGTTIFMAPERVTQDGKYSYASDVWSLGVTLWYLAVGQLPYPSTGGYWSVERAARDRSRMAVLATRMCMHAC
jgi:serine/threonine protein kinase